MQRGLKAIHINDELQAELISHKAQSAEWEQRYKDLERSHYHSDKNSSSAAHAGTSQTLVIPPPSHSFWPDPRRVTREGATGNAAGQPSVMSSSTLPLDGGGARTREQSAETRVDPSVRSGTTGPTADCPRTKEAESISFEGWPSINGFRQWRMSFRRIIASSSTKPTVALAWAS